MGRAVHQSGTAKCGPSVRLLMALGPTAKCPFCKFSLSYAYAKLHRCVSKARDVMDKFVESRGGDVGSVTPQVIGRLRGKIRKELSTELNEIDALVCGILTSA